MGGKSGLSESDIDLEFVYDLRTLDFGALELEVFLSVLMWVSLALFSSSDMI